jgi:hypothetical protein
MAATRMNDKKLKIMRIGVLAACCLVFILKIVIGPKYKIYRPFTQWGLMLTILFYILMLIVNQVKPNHQLIAILFQTTWNLNFLISLTYWAILLPVKLIYSSIKLGNAWDLIYGFAAHTFPLIGSITEILYSPLPFTPYYILYAFLLICIFGICDSTAKLCGYVESYPIILTWSNWVSIITMLALGGIVVASNLIGYKIRNRRLNRRVAVCIRSC